MVQLPGMEAKRKKRYLLNWTGSATSVRTPSSLVEEVVRSISKSCDTTVHSVKNMTFQTFQTFPVAATY